MTKTKSFLAVQIKNAAGARALLLKGRYAWALDQLIRAGSFGCSSVTQPGPNWGNYVHGLCAKGVEIETIAESNESSFSKTSPRYVLRSQVSILFDSSIYGGISE